MAKQEFTASQLSLAPSAEDFIDAKLNDVGVNLEYAEMLHNSLKKAFKEEFLSEKQHIEAIADVEEQVEPVEREFLLLKRQKKILSEDLEDELSMYSRLEDAYASIVTDKVMRASGKQKKKAHDQPRFWKDCSSYYNAVRKDEDTGTDYAFCHLSGWAPTKEIKAAHIVPKSLESEEASYLFGVKNVDLSQPRNSLPLHKSIEQALDTGLIVFVPIPAKVNQETRWKCALTDKRFTNQMAFSGAYWRQFEGKELSFLGNKRPARRYFTSVL